MREMHTIVTDVRGVCLSVCLSRGVIQCSFCHIILASFLPSVCLSFIADVLNDFPLHFDWHFS